MTSKLLNNSKHSQVTRVDYLLPLAIRHDKMPAWLNSSSFHMVKVSHSALVPYSSQQMFALINDVSAYPEFLPHCHKVDFEEQSEHVIEATLHFKKGFVSQQFTTRNKQVAEEQVVMDLVDGPFKHLYGEWNLKQLGDDGCKVSLDLEFEFANKVLSNVFSSSFRHLAESMLSAFQKRATEIYGV